MCSDVTGFPLVSPKNRDNAVNHKDGFGLGIVYNLRIICNVDIASCYFICDIIFDVLDNIRWRSYYKAYI